jgi:hypothetical protein
MFRHASSALKIFRTFATRLQSCHSHSLLSFAAMPKADTPPGYQPLKDTALFTPLQLGPLRLEHRIVQAPLTRMRSTKEADGIVVPNDLNVEYYGQRASKGGLQLTEATDIFQYASIRLAFHANPTQLAL